MNYRKTFMITYKSEHNKVQPWWVGIKKLMFRN